jgi:hypothetical protein
MSADGGAFGASTATSNEVGAAAVETSAKHRESTQRKIKDYKIQVTSIRNHRDASNVACSKN